MKKKAPALCLLITMLFTLLGGCGEKAVFLTVDGQSITKGLYTYYLDAVLSEPEKYVIDPKDRDTAINCAVECCKRYVAAEKFMSENAVTLTTQNKQNIATQVETLWSLYNAHYNAIGVTKPDITRAVTHEYRLRQIVDYYYGPQGLEPVDEWDLKEEFVDLYIGFRAVTAPLTKNNSLGETVPLTESEKEGLLNQFRAYRTEINEGTKTIDEINAEYNNTLDIIVTENLEINVVRIGDPMYTEDFYNTMLDISHTKAGIILCGNTLYLVQREKIATTAEDEFYLYRTELLEELKMGEIEENINTLAAELKAELNEDVAEDIYDLLYDGEDKKPKTASLDETETSEPIKEETTE